MQTPDNKLQIVGKPQRRFARRVSAADLSQRVRDRIAELMEWHECSDRAAEAAQSEFTNLRITAKTVSDVMHLLSTRKPPAREAMVISARRTA